MSEIDSFFATSVRELTDTLTRLESQIDPNAEPNDAAILSEVIAAIDRCELACEELGKSLANDTPLLRKTQQQFRVIIAPWFSLSWYMRHALSKPRGYAGDYLMLTAIYETRTKSLGIGGYLDRYFLQTELGKAVKNRLLMAREFLVDELLQRRQMTVLDIASGPGREYTGPFDLPADTLMQVACVDQDEAALDSIQEAIVPQLPPQIQLTGVKHNALKMGNARLNIEAFGRRDVIYSVGLFDYIPTRLLVKMLTGIRNSLAEGGVIYLAFKDCRYYNATKYQWLVDWYFYQRTEEECRDLLVDAGYNMLDVTMTRDETGSIINFICRKQPVDVVSTATEPADVTEGSEAIAE
ncbi:hypothetical protein GC163_11705 [bacterium]|nr:hypothetical protein [bacterium]